MTISSKKSHFNEHFQNYLLFLLCFILFLRSTVSPPQGCLLNRRPLQGCLFLIECEALTLQKAGLEVGGELREEAIWTLCHQGRQVMQMAPAGWLVPHHCSLSKPKALLSVYKIADYFREFTFILI